MTTATMDAETTTTGIPNGKLGTWLFIASEIMLFATIFTTYIVLRMGAPSWPVGWEALNVPLATLNTFVLISSSVTMVLAHAMAAEGENEFLFRFFMCLTVFLAFVFLGIKTLEYSAKFQHGHYPSTSIFYAVYFTATGLHALHVIGGIIWNVGITLMSYGQWKDPKFAGRVEYAGLYWHFVDIVWIFLFPALYLL